MLVAVVDAIGLGAAAFLLGRLLGPERLDRIAGGGWGWPAALGVAACIALATPFRWSFHAAVALSREAASAPRSTSRELLRASWFLALPAAAALAWLARRALAPSTDSEVGRLLAWAPEYLAAVVALSVLTILLYGEDKYVAQERRADPNAHRRIPEASLNGLALLGGWPGALAAQRTLRHKTRDGRFRASFYLATAAHLAFVAGLGFGLGLWW